MQLIGIFIRKHKNIENKVFNFSNDYYIEDENKGRYSLNPAENNNLRFRIRKASAGKHLINQYSLRVIVGINGSGKSGIINSICWKSSDAILFFHDAFSEKPFIYYQKEDYYNSKIKVIAETGEPVSLLRHTNTLKVKTFENNKSEKDIHQRLLSLYTNSKGLNIFGEGRLLFDRVLLRPPYAPLGPGNTDISDLLKRLYNKNEMGSDREKILELLYFLCFIQYIHSKKNTIRGDYNRIKEVNSVKDLYDFHNRILKEDPSISMAFNAPVSAILRKLDEVLNDLSIEINYYYPPKIRIRLALVTSKNKGPVQDLYYYSSKRLEEIKYITDFIDEKTHGLPKWLVERILVLDFVKFIEKDGVKREAVFYSDLSSGEKDIINLFANIYHQIEVDEKNTILLALDEPSNSFHPEWQRKFINNLNNLVTGINEKYGSKKIENVIITTHSPFMISDLTEDDCIFLLKGEKYGECQDGKEENKKINIKPFGANIHTLLSAPFFMSAPMGEFAENKIKAVADYYADRGNSMTEEKAKEILDLLEDGILRKLLKSSGISSGKLEKNETD